MRSTRGSRPATCASAWAASRRSSSIDDMDGAEWNTAPSARPSARYAEDLVRRLQQRFAPGGLLHYGQGKWYPGEQLPRWAFALYWRARRRSRCGATRPDRPRGDAGATATHRRCRDASAARCARSSACRPTARIPAYEDPGYFALVEQKLPINVAPEDNKLARSGRAQRARARVRARPRQAGRATCCRSRCGSAGPRPPLGHGALGARAATSCSWCRATRRPASACRSARWPTLPAVDYPARPAARSVRRARRRCPSGACSSSSARPSRCGRRPSAADRRQRDLRLGAHRAGHRAARRPPVRVHAAARRRARTTRRWSRPSRTPAAATKLPVHIEGYTPPDDPRLNVIKVTPDPGVIEVNVQPATDWDEAVDITTALYEEAQQARLGTEKFMLDGRHTGTGGGNHIVLGGITPADSPFLRRPDLLAVDHRLLAEPSLALLPVLRPVHRPDQPGAARRRGAPRSALRAGDRAASRSPTRRAARRRRGWSTASSATCWST